MNSSQRRSYKTFVVICIAVPVALLHFLTGPSYHGPFPEFVNGYLIDILLPFAFYFLLCQIETIPILRHW